jgi:outer membrane receptor for ferric coprogen and ferric-rhodotorulic acid
MSALVITTQARVNPLRRAIHLALMGMAFSLPPASILMTSSAWAQTAERELDFNIAADSLESVLAQFVTATSANVSFEPSLARGQRSAGLQGRFTTDAALNQLLADTGLQAIRQGNGNYLLTQAVSNNGSMELGATTIQGQNQGLSSVTENSGSYAVGPTSTATRFDLTARETPQTTTTVTRQQIQDFKLNNANDVLQAGGVNVQRVETDRTYYSVRGFDVSNFQIDGLGLPFSSEEQMGDIDVALYDHIEVLKGANGLTANPGNPAATVNFVRKRPTRNFQASGSISYGSWDTRRGEVDVAGPLNDSGSVRGRVIAAGQEGNSYLDRYSQSKNVFSGLLEADLTDNTTATFGYSEQRNRPNAIMWSALTLYNTDGSKARYSRSHNTAPNWSYWDTNDKQTFAEITTDWGSGWQSKASLNYRETSSDAEMFMAGGVADAQTGLGLTSYASKFERSERQLLGDVYLKGPFELFGRTHELVVGTNWSRDATHWTSRDDAAGIALPPDFNGSFPEPAFADLTSFSDYTTYRRSYYTAGHFNPTDDLKLIAGANLTQLDSSGVQVGVDHNYRKSKVTPYYGAVYDFSPNYSAYASYTEIFNPQYYSDRSNALLDPIEGNSIEGGFKGEWFDKRLNASLSLFRTRQDNTAEYGGFENGNSWYNAVDTISKGYELTVSGELAPGWQVNSGLTHLFSLTDADHNQTRTYIPQNSVYLSTSYQVPQVKGLKVGGSLNWQSEIFREQGTSTTGETIVSRQGSYAVANAMASYDIDEHFNVGLNVNNLFDRKYLTSLYWAQSYYAPSRNAMVTLSWKY